VQARVYLALVKHGRLKISAISEIAKVARPDVYRNIRILNQLGLVDSYLGTPAQFQAINAGKCLELLLIRKTQEHDTLKKETELLKTSLIAKEATEATQTSAGNFLLVPQKAMVIKIQNEAIEGAQQSIKTILSWQRFYHGACDLFYPSIKDALKRKVQFRFLVERPTAEELIEKATGICKKSEGCEVRFLDKAPETVIGIYDHKKMMILVDPMSDYPGASPALWTDNHSLVSLALEHFETKWTTTAKRL
jgi:sugar-specific transcriptional regulator TrmB